MGDDVVELLTELRENQREQLALAKEQLALSKRAVEESVRLQRLAVRRQMIGLVVVFVFVLAFVAIVATAVCLKS